MTLDEAIKHCEEKAKELREKAITDYENDKTTLAEFASCRECASEHEQLAEWLKELKAYKERLQGKWVISEIRCPNCLEYFQTDCYSTEELNKCPNCGADMRKEGAENENKA